LGSYQWLALGQALVGGAFKNLEVLNLARVMISDMINNEPFTLLCRG
jgi:hypothetical protein